VKIAIVNDAFYPLIDGVTRVVDNYARELCKLPGVDVTVVVPGPRKQEDVEKFYKDLPYKVLMCKTSGVGFDGYNQPRMARAFKREFEAAKFDLIHCHSIFSLYKFALKVAKKQGIPVVLTVHSQYRPDYKRYLKLAPLVWWWMKLTKWKLNKCDMLFSINERMDEYIRKEVGYRGESRIVGNATHFEPPADLSKIRERAYEKYGVERGANVFSFVGRLLIEKGVLIILRALAIVKARGISLKMFYVGGGFDEKQLRAEIKRLGLEDEVVLTGQLSGTEELVEIYSISKLFLFPSKFDTDGLVKREAAMCFVPSVLLEDTFTNAGIVDGVNGYISAEGDEAFADKIVEALSDEEKLQEVARAAKETLSLTWKDAVEQAYEIYKEILGKNKFTG